MILIGAKPNKLKLYIEITKNFTAHSSLGSYTKCKPPHHKGAI